MVTKSNREKILELFFQDPTKHFQLREMSRITGIGLPSVKKYAETLVEEGLIKHEKGDVYPYFIADKEDELFKTLKLNYTLVALLEIGLISKLKEDYPDCIVLFGSAAKGEDTIKSDLDIFVQSGERKTVLAKFETKMKRRISLVYESEIKKIPNELANNLANGIVVYGFLTVV